MRLTFHGAAGEVTGSNFLLESINTKALVDCGLHQGGIVCEEDNYDPFPYKPSEIDFVFATHAHIDHIGRIPKLYKDGFRGKVISTAPTKDFAKALLSDSQGILSKEARRCGKEIIYTQEDIDGVMKLWQAVGYKETSQFKDFKATFYDAGHILGSASIVLESEGKKVLFSGDLGNSPAPLIKDIAKIEEHIDYAVMESTYGGRLHEDRKERKQILEDTIEETVNKGGVLMIPAFAMERTQELLYELNELVENGRIPQIPIFLDSPLAIRLTDVYEKYSNDPEFFDKESLALIKMGDEIFNFPGLKRTLRTQESKDILKVPAPKIIIAGSGMSNGGRIVHHETAYLPDPKSTLLIIGYQARGTLGRRLLEKAKRVKIMGKHVDVRAQVKAIGGYSAHADQEALLKWLKPMRDSLKKVFLVHGEEDQAQLLESAIKDVLAINAHTPVIGESLEI